MDVAERERKEAEAELERRLAGSFETAALVRREQAVREAEQEAAVEAEATDTFLRAVAEVIAASDSLSLDLPGGCRDEGC